MLAAFPLLSGATLPKPYQLDSDQVIVEARLMHPSTSWTNRESVFEVITEKINSGFIMKYKPDGIVVCC